MSVILQSALRAPQVHVCQGSSPRHLETCSLEPMLGPTTHHYSVIARGIARKKPQYSTGCHTQAPHVPAPPSDPACTGLLRQQAGRHVASGCPVKEPAKAAVAASSTSAHRAAAPCQEQTSAQPACAGGSPLAQRVPLHGLPLTLQPSLAPPRAPCAAQPWGGRGPRPLKPQRHASPCPQQPRPSHAVTGHA